MEENNESAPNLEAAWHLPTQAEIDSDPSRFFSDHRPVLASVKLDEGQCLNVLTWNIYGGGPCGYHTKNYFESDAQIKQLIDTISSKRSELSKNEIADLEGQLVDAKNDFDKQRFARQAYFLLSQSTLDVILIQEATPLSAEVFQQFFKEEDWGIVPLAERGSVMSFYRKKSCELRNGSIRRQDPDNQDKNIKDSHSFILKLSNSETCLRVHNLWGQHHYDELNEFRQRAFNIDSLLYSSNEEDMLQILGGDLNLPLGVSTADQATVTARGLGSTDAAPQNTCIDAIMYKYPKREITLCQSDTIKYPSPQNGAIVYVPGSVYKQVQQQLNFYYVNLSEALRYAERVIEENDLDAPRGLEDMRYFIEQWKNMPTWQNVPSRELRDFFFEECTKVIQSLANDMELYTGNLNTDRRVVFALQGVGLAFLGMLAYLRSFVSCTEDSAALMTQAVEKFKRAWTGERAPELVEICALLQGSLAQNNSEEEPSSSEYHVPRP